MFDISEFWLFLHNFFFQWKLRLCTPFWQKFLPATPQKFLHQLHRKCDLQLQILWFRDNALSFTRSSRFGPLTTCDPALESLGSQLSNAGSQVSISILVAEIFAFIGRPTGQGSVFESSGVKFSIFCLFSSVRQILTNPRSWGSTRPSRNDSPRF